MSVHAETKSGAVWAKQEDSRVTKIGRILRKSRLDEIPQFLNVLKGEMNLIGPRPERPEFVHSLNTKIKKFSHRSHVKPGITGLAQVRFRYASSIEDTRKKVKYDILYINRMSLLMDLKIFFNTIVTILFLKGSR